jgi:DNA-binding MarR family transcriptional regulator
LSGRAESVRAESVRAELVRAESGRLLLEQAEGDRRGWNATLTEAGAQWLRRSECAYASSVRRHVLDNLDHETRSVLTTAARRIAHLPAGVA